MLVQLLEHLIHDALVSGYMVILCFFRSSCRVDHHIVHVHHHAPVSYKVPKDCVHHGLECGWRVSKSKEHDCWFVEPLVGDEGRLPSIFRFDQYFVVPPLDVDASKLCAVAQSVDQRGYEWEGVSVFDHPGVYRTIVLDGSEFAVLLFDEEEGCSVRTF